MPVAAPIPRVQSYYETADAFSFFETLGDGSYGEVQLASRDGNKFAVKMMPLRSPDTIKDIKREVGVQSLLNHPNIVRMYGAGQGRKTGVINCYMEYMSGGELFDIIEPDRGMVEPVAHFYLRQLVNAVSYLHGFNIVHRDIKPENILLDALGNLKLTDFGTCTKTSQDVDPNTGKAKERILIRKAGTEAYMAPECLHSKPHRGPPLDLWSMGIVLVAMTRGVLPWDLADESSSPDYFDFHTFEEHCYDQERCTEDGTAIVPMRLGDVMYQKGDNVLQDPFHNISVESPSLWELVRTMLHHDPDKRATLSSIQKSDWYRQESCLSTQCNEDGMLVVQDDESVLSRYLLNLSLGTTAPCSQAGTAPQTQSIFGEPPVQAQPQQPSSPRAGDRRRRQDSSAMVADSQDSIPGSSGTGGSVPLAAKRTRLNSGSEYTTVRDSGGVGTPNNQRPPSSKLGISMSQHPGTTFSGFGTGQFAGGGMSQFPSTAGGGALGSAGSGNGFVGAGDFYSQPARPDDLLLSQSALSSLEKLNRTAREKFNLINRMTRIFSRAPLQTVGHRLKDLTDARVGLSLKKIEGQHAFEVRGLAGARVKREIIFRICWLSVGGGVRMYEFRLKRGDGLEFKRLFRDYRDAMADLSAIPPRPQYAGSEYTQSASQIAFTHSLSQMMG
eukprot:Clim_evm9s30 gene=Clim_evmTU9s30